MEYEKNAHRMSFRFFNFKHRGADRERGFTLIELLVVTGILALISGLILTNNNRFGGAILLKNLAYDVALTVREAQVYGIAVRRFGASEFGAGYGIYFNRAAPSTYVLFADVYPSGSENGLYDAGQGEIVKTMTMQRGFRIIDICATPGGATETCGLNTLHILFKRPEPDAFISVNGVSGVQNPSALRERGRVILESARGDRISVIVEATGQIAVDD